MDCGGWTSSHELESSRVGRLEGILGGGEFARFRGVRD